LRVRKLSETGCTPQRRKVAIIGPCMAVLLNIGLLIVGATATLAAFGGETWRRGEEPITERITVRGWMSLFCLVLALSLGVMKELDAKYQDYKKQQEAKDRERALQKNLDEERARLAELGERATTAGTQLSSALAALGEEKRLVSRIGQVQSEIRIVERDLGYSGLPISGFSLSAYAPDSEEIPFSPDAQTIAQLKDEVKDACEKPLAAFFGVNPSYPGVSETDHACVFAKWRLGLELYGTALARRLGEHASIQIGLRSIQLNGGRASCVSSCIGFTITYPELDVGVSNLPRSAAIGILDSEPTAVRGVGFYVDGINHEKKDRFAGRDTDLMTFRIRLCDDRPKIFQVWKVRIANWGTDIFYKDYDLVLAKEYRDDSCLVAEYAY